MRRPLQKRSISNSQGLSWLRSRKVPDAMVRAGLARRFETFWPSVDINSPFQTVCTPWATATHRVMGRSGDRVSGRAINRARRGAPLRKVGHYARDCSGIVPNGQFLNFVSNLAPWVFTLRTRLVRHRRGRRDLPDSPKMRDYCFPRIGRNSLGAISRTGYPDQHPGLGDDFARQSQRATSST